jgi:hypothetical protein
MANKELAIKIKVDGQEVVLTGKQVEVLKKNIVDLKSELEALGERTEQNAEQFDKLRGDIESLEKAFGDTKTEAEKTGDAIQEEGKKSEEAGDKTKSYASQIRELKVQLAGLGERTAENADQYDNLTARITELSEKQEDITFGTKKLDDALGAIPGPIGKVAQGFKLLDDTGKNAGTALTKLGQQFPLLDKAIGKSGIGALIILFGLLIGAVIKAFQTFKPLQDAVGKLGIATDLLMKVIQPLIDLIGQGLTVVLEGLAKTLAFVTGNMDEYNKAVADKAATEELAKNVKKQERFLDANADKYDEYTQRKLKANLDYNKKVVELNEQFKNGEIKSQQELNSLLAQYREKANREINKADKDRSDKAAEQTKQANEKAQQVENDFQKKLLGIQQENAILRIADEKQKGELKLKQELDNQLKEIEQLKLSEKKKQQLRDETNANYRLKLKEFNDNIIKEQKKADEDLVKQNRDMKISMIENEKERMAAEAAARRDDSLKAIDETKASEEAKAAAKLVINQKYASDIAKIDEEIAKKNKENVYKQIEFERQSRELGLSNRLKEIDLSFASEVDRIKARRLVLDEQAKIDFDAETTNLKKLLETKEIDETEHKNRLKLVNDAYNLSLRENSIKTEMDLRDARMNNIQLLNQLGAVIGTVAGAMGEETSAGKALIKVQQGLALAATTLAIAESLRGLGKDLAKGFPTNVIAVISTLALMATAFSQFKQLTGKGPKDISGGGGDGAAQSGPTQVMGKNYADGGMIGGRRHAQGGTLVEAEQGEAIMTRGAVTLFKPMLSMMNQMGGGTSFTPNLITTSYDNPVRDNPAEKQQSVIMKTYVVSNELTTEAEKQARLKDLSTL